MKIVVTGTRGIPDIMGGVETHCEELFPRIVERGDEVTVIRRTNYVKDELTEWRGVKLVSVDSPKKKSFEAIIHTFRAINKAKALGADVLHVHAIGPAMLTPYAKIRGMKVVFTHHGPDYDRDKWGLAAKAMLKLGERMGCEFADEVIVISEVIKNLIAKKYGRTEHVHLIYNGVPKPDVCDYPEYFEGLGIEKGKYILGMCRFVPEKNLHHLIEAFAKTEHGDCKLVLAGDTDFEDDYSRGLKKMAKENDVVLTGFIKGKKLHSLLSHCRGYCLPSSHEGLPISLLEAMSYGDCCLVSSIEECTQVTGDHAVVFEKGNIRDLKEKLQYLLDHPDEVKRLQDTASEFVCEKFNWDDVVKRTIHVYCETG